MNSIRKNISAITTGVGIIGGLLSFYSWRRSIMDANSNENLMQGQKKRNKE